MKSKMIACTLLTAALSLLISCGTERDGSETEPDNGAHRSSATSRHRTADTSSTRKHARSHESFHQSGEDQSVGSTGSAMGAE